MKAVADTLAVARSNLVKPSPHQAASVLSQGRGRAAVGADPSARGRAPDLRIPARLTSLTTCPNSSGLSLAATSSTLRSWNNKIAVRHALSGGPSNRRLIERNSVWIRHVGNVPLPIGLGAAGAAGSTIRIHA
jgi:hypothetical protein